MAPTLPFDEMGIVLTTMVNGVTALYFLVVIFLNLLGMYLADLEMDRREAMNNPNGKGYIYEWIQLIPYAIASAIFTMVILEVSAVSFWYSLLISWMTGMVFRPILPEFTKAATLKISSVFDAILGKT